MQDDIATFSDESSRPESKREEGECVVSDRKSEEKESTELREEVRVVDSTMCSKSAQALHLPSLHMQLGKDICSIGKAQHKRMAMHDDSFLFCEYPASLTEEDLSDLFSDTSNQPPKRAKREEAM